MRFSYLLDVLEKHLFMRIIIHLLACSLKATGDNTVAVGGQSNEAAGHFTFVGAGHSNTATGHYSATLSGINNHAMGYSSAIGGGAFNTAGTPDELGGFVLRIFSLWRGKAGGGGWDWLNVQTL